MKRVVLTMLIASVMMLMSCKDNGVFTYQGESLAGMLVPGNGVDGISDFYYKIYTSRDSIKLLFRNGDHNDTYFEYTFLKDSLEVYLSMPDGIRKSENGVNTKMSTFGDVTRRTEEVTYSSANGKVPMVTTPLLADNFTWIVLFLPDGVEKLERLIRD